MFENQSTWIHKECARQVGQSHIARLFLARVWLHETINSGIWCPYTVDRNSACHHRQGETIDRLWWIIPFFLFLEGVNSHYSFLLICCSLAINNSLLQHPKYKSLSDNSCWTKHASKQQLNVSLLVPNSLHAIYYSAGITHQDMFYNSPLIKD